MAVDAKVRGRHKTEKPQIASTPLSHKMSHLRRHPSLVMTVNIPRAFSYVFSRNSALSWLPVSHLDLPLILIPNFSPLLKEPNG